MYQVTTLTLATERCDTTTLAMDVSMRDVMIEMGANIHV